MAHKATGYLCYRHLTLAIILAFYSFLIWWLKSFIIEGAGIRYNSSFSPSCPGFDSRRSLNLFFKFILNVAEIYQQSCLEQWTVP